MKCKQKTAQISRTSIRVVASVAIATAVSGCVGINSATELAVLKAGDDLIAGHAQRHCYSGDLDRFKQIGKQVGTLAKPGNEVTIELSSSKRDYGSESDGGC